ncbi:hypothetical protein Tco_0967386 [Tanacetum coccineum]
MSDFEHSTVTYTSVPKDDSDIGSPGVEGPNFQDPPSYRITLPAPCGDPITRLVPGPECSTEQAPPSLYHTICYGCCLPGVLHHCIYRIRTTSEEEPEVDDEEDPEEVPGRMLRVGSVWQLVMLAVLDLPQDEANLYGFTKMLEAGPGRQMSRELGLWLRLSRAAWAQSMDAYDQVHSEGISLRTTVMAQQSEITELQAADRRRQSVISDLLKADHRRQRQLVEALKIVKSLKTQMIELQRQQGPAKDPAEPELPEEASSSS